MNKIYKETRERERERREGKGNNPFLKTLRLLVVCLIPVIGLIMPMGVVEGTVTTGTNPASNPIPAGDSWIPAPAFNGQAIGLTNNGVVVAQNNGLRIDLFQSMTNNGVMVASNGGKLRTDPQPVAGGLISFINNNGFISIASSSFLDNQSKSQRAGVTINNNVGGVIHNKNGGTFLNSPCLAFVGVCTFNQNGRFINDGTFQGNLVNNGTLLGSGTVTGSLTNNATFLPGNSPGVFAVGGNHTENGNLTIEIGGLSDVAPDYDYITVGGNLTLGASSKLILDFFQPAPFNFDGSSLAIGDFIDIIRYAGTRTGTFNMFDDSLATPPVGFWSIDYDHVLGGGINSVRLTLETVVPESETYLLLGSFLLVAIWAKRKRATS